MQLQSLILSGLGLSGPLESTQQPGLQTIEELQHRDISHNPRIAGHLPNSWYALGALQTLDMSNTGVSGTLPPAYAALQQLREFRAANCSSIAGPLPATWGLLKPQVLEVTNSGLTGVLPLEWADAMALQQAWQAAVATAEPRESKEASAAVSAAATVAGQRGAAGSRVLGLQRLRVLDLSGLTGALPSTSAAMDQLEVLMLAGHNFDSTMPAAWTRMEQLRVLDVSKNSLTGSLPSWYTSMRQLAVLKVHNNKLVRAVKTCLLMQQLQPNCRARHGRGRPPCPC